MYKSYNNGDNGLATLKSEIVAGYNTTKITKLPGFHFVYGGDNGDVFHIFFELDYGMWCISIFKNWRSRTDYDACLLDSRACNLTPDYKTMRWSNKVVDRAVELISKTIA